MVVNPLRYFVCFYFRIFKMIDNMKNFARVIEAKSKELGIEKRKTENLLSRMLPKSVAEQLKLVGIIQHALELGNAI